MLLNNTQHNYILSLILEDKRRTEELLNCSDSSNSKKLEEDLKMAKTMILNFKITSCVNFESKENLLAKEYLFIKQYDGKEYFWQLDCLSYTRDIAFAGTFTEDEAKHYFRGLIFNLLDLINGKASGKEGYAVSVADYISYQKALIK